MKRTGIAFAGIASLLLAACASDPEPVVVGDTAYVLDGAGLVAAIDIRDGQVQWRQGIESLKPLVTDLNILGVYKRGKHIEV